VLFGAVGYAHAITYYVDTSSIPAGEIRGSDGYCSLAEAIAAANAGANQYCTYTQAQFWTLDMTHTGSTTGRFIYIRAGAAAAVYDSKLSGGNVTGFSNGYGGATHDLGTLDLGFGTQLLNNSADNGGAIYDKDARINVYDATLEGNRQPEREEGSTTSPPPEPPHRTVVESPTSPGRE
jgi:hypothetical protein